MASRNVARLTPSCFASSGSEGNREPAGMFEIIVARSPCNRWNGKWGIGLAPVLGENTCINKIQNFRLRLL
jgi:hypothetical protein